MIDRIKNWARKLKGRIFVLYYAYKDPRTPWYAKVFAICVIAYAFSPIVLIPDFIPVLGYLDDLILIPFGAAIALRMIPPDVVQENEEKAEQRIKSGKPKNWLAGSLIILIRVAAVLWISLIIYRYTVN